MIARLRDMDIGMAKKKKALLLVIGAAISFALWLAYPVPVRQLSIDTPSGPVKIPAEIMAAKDCAQYGRFLKSLARPGFIPDAPCPFIRSLGKANLAVGDTILSIPREYFGYDKFKKDGPIDAVFLLFHYPDMEPIRSEEEHNQSLSIVIEGFVTETDPTKHKMAVQDYRTNTFRTYTLQDAVHRSNTKTIPAPEHAIPVDGSSFKTYRLEVYQLDGQYSQVKDVFYKGPYKNPTAWFVCDIPIKLEAGIIHPVNPRCLTHFFINDHLRAKLSYPRRFEKNHAQIEQLVREKIESFAIQKE